MTGPQGLGPLIGMSGPAWADSEYDSIIDDATTIWFSEGSPINSIAEWPTWADTQLLDYAIEAKKALYWFNAWFNESGFAPSDYASAIEMVPDILYEIIPEGKFAVIAWPSTADVFFFDRANEINRGMFWFNAWYEEAGEAPSSYLDALNAVGGLMWYNELDTLSSTDAPSMGGVITTAGGYRVHTFTITDYFWSGKIGSLSVEAFVVGGGGAGGSGAQGGGGGAGGVSIATHSVVNGALCTIGAGAVGSGNDGSPSSFGSFVTVPGGGGGGNAGAVGRPGGCGGGASGPTTLLAVNPGGTGSHGGNGGDGYGGTSSTSQRFGGGGGGGGGDGEDGTSAGSPAEGNYGIEYPSGSGVFYAGGGHGGLPYETNIDNNPGGGGGVFGTFVGSGRAGTSGKGAGGGGSRSDTGGNGGSGIIIVRVPI